MELTIHNSKLRQIAIIDDESQGTLNFYDDFWTRKLETGASVYEFKVFKKAIRTSGDDRYDWQYLVVGNFVSFRYNDEDYLFKIIDVNEESDYIYVYSENLTLELTNETANPYAATKAMSLVEYLNAFDMLNMGGLQVGVNEVSEKRLTLKWEGAETKLQRLVSITQNFDAELEFRTELKDHGSIKSFIVNFYKENDSRNQGVGRKRNDVILMEDDNLSSISVKTSIRDLFTMTKPKGKRRVAHTTVVKNAVSKTTTVSANQKYTGGAIRYANGSLSIANIQAILTLCVKHSLLPSGVISQLYLESFWGNSLVGRTDNNWSGMSGGAQRRPSGVTVTTGMARPANEGGTYMHYASVSDFFKDYTYLLAEQTSGGKKFYGVKGKTNISDYTKGLFRVGGALYDYAAAGYSRYITLMTDIRNGVNRNNGNILDKLDKQWSTPVAVPTATNTKGAPKTKSVLNQLAGLMNRTLGTGQCYSVASWYASRLGGPGLGAGINAISGRVGGGMAAALIGTDYAWSRYGWSVQKSGFSNIKAGCIANIKANNGSPVWTGVYGHTVVVEKVTATTITVLEQNFAGIMSVRRNTYNKAAYITAIQSLCYPPEIAKGGDVYASTSTTTTKRNSDGTTSIVQVVQPEEVEVTEEEKDLFINPSLYREWKDDDGNVEFFLKNGALYAPKAMEQYSSVFSGDEIGDNWIRQDFEYDIDNEERLISESIEKLKKFSVPKIDYTVEGYIDGDIGDSFQLESDRFRPKLILEARISEQVISLSNPDNNKTTFSNYRKFDNRVSNDLTAEMARLAEEAKPYELKFQTSDGVSFKNNEGSSLLTVTLEKSGKEYDALFFFKSGDAIVGTGKQLLVNATDFVGIWHLTIEAYIDNELVAQGQLTFTDTNDGQKGEKGDTGPIGPPGPQGEKGALDEEQVAEINAKVDTKAEEALTQEQLNALNELAQQNKAELEAKATLDDLSTLQKFINDMKEQDEAGRQKTLEELKVLANRVTANIQQIGEMKNVTEFVSTYISESEEGMVIGQKDGSSLVKVSSDRISFVSAGDEVAYISQGVLHIDNGIFAISVQIGHFITKQHPDNEYINMTYFVA